MKSMTDLGCHTEQSGGAYHPWAELKGTIITPILTIFYLYFYKNKTKFENIIPN